MYHLDETGTKRPGCNQTTDEDTVELIEVTLRMQKDVSDDNLRVFFLAAGSGAMFYGVCIASGCNRRAAGSLASSAGKCRFTSLG
jgi:hypothetical protein